MTPAQQKALDELKKPGIIAEIRGNNVFFYKDDSARVYRTTFQVLQALIREKHVRREIRRNRISGRLDHTVYYYAAPGEVDEINRREREKNQADTRQREAERAADKLDRNERWTAALLKAFRCTDMVFSDQMDSEISSVFDAIVSEVNVGHIPGSLTREALQMERLTVRQI